MGDYKSIIARERGRIMGEFLAEENFDVLRKLVGDDHAVMFGVHPSGTPYASLSAAVLLAESYKVFPITLFVTKRGKGKGKHGFNVSGYNGNLGDYRAIIFEEDWSRRGRNYAVVGAVDSAAKETFLVTANPFETYTKEEIVRDEFNGTITGDPEACMTLDELGPDVKSVVEKLGPASERYLNGKGIIVEVFPEGTPFAMGTALFLKEKGVDIRYVQVEKNDSVENYLEDSGSFEGSNLLIFGDTDAKKYCSKIEEAKDKFDIKSVSFRNTDDLLKKELEG